MFGPWVPAFAGTNGSWHSAEQEVAGVQARELHVLQRITLPGSSVITTSALTCWLAFRTAWKSLKHASLEDHVIAAAEVGHDVVRTAHLCGVL